MTNLIEQIKLTITLHRDEQPNFPFDDLLPGLKRLSRKGAKRIGGVSYEWEKTGLFEIPEVGFGAGDN